MVLGLGIISFIILQFNPNMYDFISWKLMSFFPSNEGSTNASSSVRLIELKNIWHEQWISFYKLFVGAGWGGYFTSAYTSFNANILGTTSYPPEWIVRDQFFQPHGTWLHILLKYGLLGLIMFYGSLVFYCWRHIFNKTIYSIESSKSTGSAWTLRYIEIVLSIILPISCLIIYTSKLQVLTGFFLAMLSCSGKEIKSLVKMLKMNDK